MKKPIKNKIKNDHLKSGAKVGKYKIERKLSSGGFGVVYLASRDDGHLVALKEFLPSVISCRPQGGDGKIKFKDEYDAKRFEDGLKAFFREADTLAQVHNDRIIPIWDVFKERGTAYFAMPVERGGTLQTLVRMKNDPLTENELRSIFVQACKGVEALHDKGLLHLDIKPSNLWVRPDRSVVVLDLGASRWEDEQVKSSQMARTPGFAAPEQHSKFSLQKSKEKKNNKSKVSVRTDVYGLCASLLSCLISRPPTPAPMRKPFDNPISWDMLGQYSPDLLKVIDKGMQLKDQFRYASVKELRYDLEKLPRLSDTTFIDEGLSDFNLLNLNLPNI